MPLPFAAANGAACGFLIANVFVLVVFGLLLWWFIQAFFKYRWFRWLVLILFLLPVGCGMASLLVRRLSDIAREIAALKSDLRRNEARLNARDLVEAGLHCLAR